MAEDRQLITEREVEERYGIPRSTLQDWRYRQIGPPWYKPSRRVYYRVSDIEAWLEQGRRGNGEK